MTTTVTKAAVVAERRPAQRRTAGVGRPGFAWALPATAFFVLFAVVPLVLVAVLSFTSWNGLGSPGSPGSTTGPSSSTTR